MLILPFDPSTCIAGNLYLSTILLEEFGYRMQNVVHCTHILLVSTSTKFFFQIIVVCIYFHYWYPIMCLWPYSYADTIISISLVPKLLLCLSFKSILLIFLKYQFSSFNSSQYVKVALHCLEGYQELAPC